MNNRWMPRCGAAAFAIATAALLVHSPALGQGTQGRDVSGIWWSIKYSPKLEIVGGGDIPYNDKGRALYAQNIAGLKAGSIHDEARRFCVPDGVPRILGNPYPFKIIQTPGQTTIAYELNRVFRVVVMDKPQESQRDLEILPY